MEPILTHFKYWITNIR